MIDKNLVTPLYIQIADELKKEILSGKYGEHGCLETHAQLVERFGVSLITIRKAFEILQKDGLVEIQRGKGTFVRRSTVVDPLKKLTGISNIISSMKIGNEVEVPVFELQDPPEWMDEETKEALGEKTLFIRRIVSLNGVPAANTDMYLPGKYYPDFTREEVEKKTVYRIYQDAVGLELGHGRQMIRAAGASELVADNLKIKVGAPVLEITRKAYDNENQLIEYMILTYEASKYCFEVELELSKE